MPLRIGPLLAAATVCAFATPRSSGAASPPSVLAAENFYGDVAQQLAGPHASVASVLSNPDQDPHLFEASPSVAREVATARIVVVNGADYDPWAEKLLAAAKPANRTDDRRRRSRRQGGGRQSPSLVRSGHDAGLCPCALGGTRVCRSAQQGRLRPAPDAIPRFAQAASGEDRGDEGQIRGHAGHRDGAGVRLHGGRPRPDDAQRAFPARSDERHRAGRVRYRRLRDRSAAAPRSSCCCSTARRPTRRRNACSALPRRPACRSSA